MTSLKDGSTAIDVGLPPPKDVILSKSKIHNKAKYPSVPCATNRFLFLYKGYHLFFSSPIIVGIGIPI
jgi:hypothetical protein